MDGTLEQTNAYACILIALTPVSRIVLLHLWQSHLRDSVPQQCTQHRNKICLSWEIAVAEMRKRINHSLHVSQHATHHGAHLAEIELGEAQIDLPKLNLQMGRNRNNKATQFYLLCLNILCRSGYWPEISTEQTVWVWACMLLCTHKLKLSSLLKRSRNTKSKAESQRITIIFRSDSLVLGAGAPVSGEGERAKGKNGNEVAKTKTKPS